MDVTNLTESFGASFGVSGFTRSGDELTWTKTSPGKLWTFSITTGDLSLASIPYTPYQSWASSKGLTAANNATGMDPDGDGTDNLAEYAFNGDPLNGTDNGKVHLLTQDNDSGRKLNLTLAVRKGTPAFIGEPSPASAVWDGITYTVEGSDNLSGFPAKVNILAAPVVRPTYPLLLALSCRLSLDRNRRHLNDDLVRCEASVQGDASGDGFWIPDKALSMRCEFMECGGKQSATPLWLHPQDS